MYYIFNMFKVTSSPHVYNNILYIINSSVNFGLFQ